MPKTVEKRLTIARRIVECAESIDIPRENVILDCLATAIGADMDSGHIVLESIRRIRQELGGWGWEPVMSRLTGPNGNLSIMHVAIRSESSD